VRETRRALAETLRRIDSLLAGAGLSRATVLDLERLALDSGETREVVEALLDGKELPAEDMTRRIVRRFKHLRETRYRADGTRFSYMEIAESFGATRARLSNLVSTYEKSQPAHGGQGEGNAPARSGGPLAATQAGIETFFFGEPNGWLAADPETTLKRALEPVLEKLLTQSDEMPRHRAVALRSAAALPDDQWKLVEGVIASLVRQVREEHPPSL
jgi:hypothetical protein